MKRALFLILIIVAAGCAVAAHRKLDQVYGQADPARFDTAVHSATDRSAWEKADAVFSSRCVVCHACYDAPCQLKLTSWDGVTRGGSKESIYALRLLETAPTRLHFDAQTNAEWRQKGFHPVLNERSSTPAANREGSVMQRLLDLKRRHAPETGILPADKYDFSLSRAQQCVASEEVEQLEKDRPELGMPFGMPQLRDDEYRTLTQWIRDGAPYAPAPALAAPYAARVADWEAFLNGDSVKQQLMSRYIYEHWYLGHFYFDDLPTAEWFELVRSKTPPGTPIEVIATRRPYDDPGVARVYYRLRRMDETLVAKTHMPYALDAARMKRLRSLFLDPAYDVAALPSYDPDTSANPFVTFAALPVDARYRLMLDEAQYTIMNFIKGPVCRGQVALNVINDLFWVAFLDPKIEMNGLGADGLARALREMVLPATEADSMPVLKWKRYANTENEYLQAKSAYLNANFGAAQAPKLSMLWDGDGRNPNAALTVFRHFDSATVVQGFVGERPQTAWVVGYPLLERIHYLLVAGYDVYGNVGHQVTTRMYMDFLRMEGESNFLAFLPLASRDAVRDHWYRGVDDDVKAYLQGSRSYFGQDTGVRFRTSDPLTEMYGLLQKRESRVLDHRFDLDTKGLPPAAQKALARLDQLHGASTAILPEVSFVTVTSSDRERQYTVLHNSAHKNISTMFDETKNRLPEEDTLSVVSGFLGAYPNAFFEVSAADLPAFVDAVADLHSEEDYAALITKFGIRRTDDRFWQHSDTLIAAYRKARPIEAGVFDYGRYENR